jgi:hypothetical protein
MSDSDASDNDPSLPNQADLSTNIPQRRHKHIQAAGKLNVDHRQLIVFALRDNAMFLLLPLRALSFPLIESCPLMDRTTRHSA